MNNDNLSETKKSLITSGFSSLLWIFVALVTISLVFVVSFSLNAKAQDAEIPGENQTDVQSNIKQYQQTNKDVEENSNQGSKFTNSSNLYNLSTDINTDYTATVTFESGQVSGQEAARAMTQGWTVSSDCTAFYKSYTDSDKTATAVSDFNSIGLSVSASGKDYKGVYYAEEVGGNFTKNINLTPLFVFNITKGTTSYGDICTFSNEAVSSYKFISATYEISSASPNVVKFTNATRYDESEKKLYSVADFTLTCNGKSGTTFEKWNLSFSFDTKTAITGSISFAPNISVVVNISVNPSNSGNVVNESGVAAQSSYRVEYYEEPVFSADKKSITIRYFNNSHDLVETTLTGKGTSKYSLVNMTASSVWAAKSSNFITANFAIRHSITVYYKEGAPKSTSVLAACGWTYNNETNTATQYFNDGTKIADIFTAGSSYWKDGCQAEKEGYTAAFSMQPSGVLTADKSYSYTYTLKELNFSANATSSPAITGHEGGSVQVYPIASENQIVYYGDTITIDSTTNNLFIKSDDGLTAVIEPTASDNWKFKAWHAYYDGSATDIIDNITTSPGITANIKFVAEFQQDTVDFVVYASSLNGGTLTIDGVTKTDDTTLSIPKGYFWSTSKTESGNKHDDTITICDEYGTSTTLHTINVSKGTNELTLFADNNNNIVENVTDKEATEGLQIYPVAYSSLDTVKVEASVYDTTKSEINVYKGTSTTPEESTTFYVAKPVNYEKVVYNDSTQDLRITDEFGCVYTLKAKANSSAEGYNFIGWAYKTESSWKWLTGESGHFISNVKIMAVFATTATVNFSVAEDSTGLGTVSSESAVFANVGTIHYTISENNLTVYNESTGELQTVTASPNENNTFKQWQDASGNKLSDTGTVSANDMFYASFTKGRKATMSAGVGNFNALPHGWNLAEDGAYAYKYFEQGTAYSTIASEWTKNYRPTKTGYTFSGWSPDTTSGTLENDTLFIAQYSANTVPVTFYMNSGKVSQTDMKNWTYDEYSDSYTNSTDYKFDQDCSGAQSDFLSLAGKITREGFNFNDTFYEFINNDKLQTDNAFICQFTYDVNIVAKEGGSISPTAGVLNIEEGYITGVSNIDNNEQAGKLSISFLDESSQDQDFVASPAFGYVFSKWTDLEGKALNPESIFYQNSTIYANFKEATSNDKNQALPDYSSSQSAKTGDGTLLNLAVFGVIFASGIMLISRNRYSIKHL